MGLLEIVIFGEDTQFDAKVLRLARLPRLYRLIRITRLFKLSKLFKKSPLIEKIDEFFEKNARFSFFITLMLALGLITCVHIIGCFWYYFAKLNDLGPETWVVRCNLQNESNLTVYLASIYWAFQTLLTVGYGDIGAGVHYIN